jgi:hypothetical protein
MPIVDNFTETYTEYQAIGYKDPGFTVNPPVVLADFELKEDSPMWALGWERIPIENIGSYV